MAENPLLVDPYLAFGGERPVWILNFHSISAGQSYTLKMTTGGGQGGDPSDAVMETFATAISDTSDLSSVVLQRIGFATPTTIFVE